MDLFAASPKEMVDRLLKEHEELKAKIEEISKGEANLLVEML
jgi:hypothetical protein